MKVTKEELVEIENNVRTVIKEQITDLPKETIIALLLIAANNIGVQIVGKEPQSVDETKNILDTGINFLFHAHAEASQYRCNTIDAALTFRIGHA